MKQLNKKHFASSSLIRVSQAERADDEETADIEEGHKLSPDSTEELETKPDTLEQK